MIDPNDNGLKSRKLWLTCLSMGLVAAGGVLAAFRAAFSPLYSTFVGGILGALSIYASINVVGKHVIGNVNVKADQVDSEKSPKS